MQRHLWKSAALGLAALVLAACGGSTTGSGGGTSTGAVPIGAPDVAVVDGGKTGYVAGDTVTSPTIIRTGDMTLTTSDVASVFDKVKQAVLDAGGRVESSSYFAGDRYSTPSGQVTARIPEAKLDAAITAISAIAKRTALNISSNDVTLQRVDLEAKVKALTAARNRLQDLVAKATKVSDLIEAENALAQRQAELDSYQGQLDYLKSQAAESTLGITIASSETPVTTGLRGWGDTFRQSVRNFLGAIQSVIMFVGAALPWLVGLALLAWVVKVAVTAVRRARLRRRKG